MTKPITSLVAALGLAILAVTTVTPAAGAATPETFPVSFTSSGTINCGSFKDNFTDVVEGSGTVYFDQAGNPVRAVLQLSHTSTDVNSRTGLTLHEHGHYTQTFDLVAGTVTYTGAQEVMNRHGVGVVVQDTGRVVYDFDGNLIFFAGGRKHSEVVSGDQVLCDALA